MNITRAPRRRGFVIIPNRAVEDTRLSYRARGVLAYLLSRPDGWQTDSDRLAEQAPEGRDAVRTALRELEGAGYLRRTKRQGDGGRWITETVVTDDPTDDGFSGVGATSDDATFPQVGPATGNPTPGDPSVGGPGAVVPSKTESKTQGGVAARLETADGAVGGCADHRDRRRPACAECQRVVPLHREQVKPADPSHAKAARAALRRTP